MTKRMRQAAEGKGRGGALKPTKATATPKPQGAAVVLANNNGQPLTRRQEIRVVTKGFCLCGCGGAANARRLFLQGHDAKAKGLLLRVRKGEMAESALPASIRQLLPTIRTCGCCGSPLWLGGSECEHKRCSCAARAEIAKTNAKPSPKAAVTAEPGHTTDGRPIPTVAEAEAMLARMAGMAGMARLAGVAGEVAE